MSALELELPAALEATEPPEARGLARDEVRLMVTRCADPSLEHSRFRDLPAHLRAGDLLIVNNSMTLPAAVPGERGDGESVEVRFSTLAPEGAGSGTASVPDSGEDQPQGPRLIVELRSADGTLPLGDGHAAQWIALAGGAGLQLLEPFNGSGRLWVAELAGVGDLHYYLGRFGHPIRYRYVPRRWPLRAYQNVYGSVPGSAEMASAGRPLTARLLARLVAAGVLIAPITLHTGVSSAEAHEPPFPEQFSVPAATARLVEHVRSSAGRVIAVGTTAVRAIESATRADGSVAASGGWTSLVICPERPVRVIDGLLTGWHEPQASHLLMLEAIAGREAIERSYRAALASGYLWHEFGDSHLILP